MLASNNINARQNAARYRDVDFFSRSDVAVHRHVRDCPRAARYIYSGSVRRQRSTQCNDVMPWVATFSETPTFTSRVRPMEKLLALTGATPGATLLLAAIVLVSLVGLFAAPSVIEHSMFRPFWLVSRREYSTLITSGFVHADLGHLFFNAFTFGAFAFALEREIGTARFLALYLFGLLMSDLGTYFKHRGDPDYRCLGASGAILAVLFASVVYFPANSIFILPIPVPIPAPVFALCYLAYSFYASRQARGRVNHDAHLVGALAGIAFVALTDSSAFAHALSLVLG